MSDPPRPGLVDRLLARGITPRWPQPFRLEPSDASFAPRATFVIDNRAHIDAPPEQVFDDLVFLPRGRSWLEQFLHLRWIGPDAPLEGRSSDQTFTFMTLRIRIVAAERGRRVVTSVDASSLPLARWMCEEATFEPAGGGTDFHWRIYSDPLPVLSPARPLIEPVFNAMFRRSTERLAALFRPGT
jgi:Polyketide cyclase / dehydrase and lipid transport